MQKRNQALIDMIWDMVLINFFLQNGKRGNLFLPTEGIQKKVLGVLADSCRHMVVYALKKETDDDCFVYELATISICQIYMP